MPVYTGSKRKLEYDKKPINNQVFKEVQRIQSQVRESLGTKSVETGLRQELIDDPKVIAELIVDFLKIFLKYLHRLIDIISLFICV